MLMIISRNTISLTVSLIVYIYTYHSIYISINVLSNTEILMIFIVYIGLFISTILIYLNIFIKYYRYDVNINE